MNQIDIQSNHLILISRARDEAIAQVKEKEQVVSELNAKIDELRSDMEEKQTATDRQLKQKDLCIEQIEVNALATETERSTLAN